MRLKIRPVYSTRQAGRDGDESEAIKGIGRMRRHGATGRETGERIRNRRGYKAGGETIKPDRDPTR